jgi:hypothetical protein
MTATIIVAFLGLLPVVAFFSVAFAARQRPTRPPCLASSPPRTADDTETLATRLLLAGAIGQQEYRHVIGTLAAADEIAHPVRIPQR